MIALLALYLSALDDRNFEEEFTEVYNTYKRLVYHTAYKIMGDSYLAEDMLQEVFLYVAKNFSKIHRENCHELAAYYKLESCICKMIFARRKSFWRSAPAAYRGIAQRWGNSAECSR